MTDLHENETACRTLFHMKGFALVLNRGTRELGNGLLQVFIKVRSSFMSIEFSDVHYLYLYFVSNHMIVLKPCLSESVIQI